MRKTFIFLILALVLALSLTATSVSEDVIFVDTEDVTVYGTVEDVIEDLSQILGYVPNYTVFDQDRILEVYLIGGSSLEFPVVLDEGYGITLVGWEFPDLEEYSIKENFRQGGSLADLFLISPYAEFGRVITEQTGTKIVEFYSEIDEKANQLELVGWVEKDGEIYLPAEQFRQAFYFLNS